MSLKIRLTLFTAGWLLLILILVNIFVYTFFIKVTIQSEVQLLFNKANTILQNEKAQHPQYWNDESLLNEFLLYNELIRIVDQNHIVRNQVNSNQELLNKPVQFRMTPHTEVIRYNGRKSIFIQVPIYEKQTQIGMLEIGKQLVSLNYYADILMSVLIATSSAAVLLAISGGYLYSRLLLKPISQLAHTMQSIEQSGTYQRLNIKKSPYSDELDQLGETFNEMMGKLEENFHREKQFVADASHELRTPLTIIESYASLLKRWASNDQQIREEAIEAIHSESIRLKGLIDSLLSVAENHEEVFHQELFSLVPLVQTQAANLQQAYDRMIKVHAEPSNIEMIGDPEKIKQLLIILLDNAIKYSDKEIQVNVKEDKNTIQLMITDQGIGINPEHLPRLFERFYRVDKARNRKTGGVGLGLTIGKRIVKQHEGTIEIASKHGFGTTVTVKFPK